jgi:hypothetical protein
MATDYGWEHQKVRASWAPIVNAGDAWCSEPVCLMRDRWIRPGSPWDLAHDRDTGGYRGPAHARCNRSEGSRWWHSRQQRKVVQRPREPRRWAL